MQIKEEKVSQQANFLTYAFIIRLQEVHTRLNDGVVGRQVMQILSLARKPHLL